MLLLFLRTLKDAFFSNEDFNFFFLANTNPEANLTKYTKAKINIKKLCSYLVKNECLYFTDRDAYNEKIQKSLGKYNKYCSNWAELLVTANDVDQIELESTLHLFLMKKLILIFLLPIQILFFLKLI